MTPAANDGAELRIRTDDLAAVVVRLQGEVEALARDNGDLRSRLASIAIATVFLDCSTRITLFTPSAASLFKLVPADIGLPLGELNGRLDYPEILADVGAVLDRLAPIEREVRSGARWLLARVAVCGDSAERIAGVVLTFLDITVRREAAAALRESEARYRAIFNQAAAGVVHADLDGRITLVNSRFAQIAGRPVEALHGMSLFDLVHPDDRARDVAAFGHMIENGTPCEMEKRYVQADGGVVWVNCAIAVTRADAGQPVSVSGTVLDVTQRQQALQALRQSEERLRLVVESAREYAILSMDLERRVTSWNRGAEELTGYRERDIVGRSADLIFTEEDRAGGAPEREAQQALADGRAADERWHRRRNGSRFWGSGVMMAMHETVGSAPIGLLKIFRDQTNLRTAAQALETSRAELVQALVDNRRARAEAEAASDAKDRFLAILSHELRTPLTPVMLALHALERSTELPAQARGTVELIRRNVKAELLLIDDLLDVTRISSGKLEMAREQTDMHEVVRAAAAVCEADFAAKRQRLHLDLGAQRHAVAGDAARLRQVVWNLLKNASKFTPNEGQVRIETHAVDDCFHLVVADTGIGIAAEALPLIFDAFAQEGQWVTSEFGGLGLGLAIAKATVEAHHGRLIAASGGRNQGATFSVDLPLA